MNSKEIRDKFLAYFKSNGHEIVESSSLIPKDDPTLLFTNSGMVQFKRSFLGQENRGCTRAATSQKCVRAGGKHNDLDNVGYTLRHHTFFEMLGNFSFGDYFKEEAILWAWELLTEGYGLTKDRLYVSVYNDDDEAFRIWEKKIGVPAERIVRLGEKDNFWAMGDTGPCGPCSEILFDQGPSLGCGKPDCGPGCDCDRYLEIWNLVFTQFDRDAEGELTPLPRPNIDTGMGLERLAAVIQGVSSNYDTDLFQPIIGLIQELSNKKYGSDNKQDVAFRVISDHARAITFLIGDGIMPSNEGRGYVLRRIIRRAIRYGQVLGLKEGFLCPIISRVIEIMGPFYDELVKSSSFIEGVAGNEEKRFSDTLHYSMRVLDEEIERVKANGYSVIPGEAVFRLYDTYGLSPDIIEDVARDENLVVDMDGYEKAMSRQKAMSQESWKGSGEEDVPEVFKGILARDLTRRFLGYETISSRSKVVAIVAEGKEVSSAEAGSKAEVVLDETPFYGRAGGQVGDTGLLLQEGLRFRVLDTVKLSQKLIIHQGIVESGTISVGKEVEAKVDEVKRNSIALNHSATHLLHKALREVLGDHVKQAGSMVSPDRLRFDFSHFTQVSQDHLRDVERIVNMHIRDNLPVSVTEMSKEDAMKTGAMAIFEEKYGDVVRLVSIGDGVSMELCGGTHTDRTGNIGLFRVVSESAVAANVRRIEAITGETAVNYTQKQDADLRLTASLIKTTADGVVERLERLMNDYKEKEKEVQALKAMLISNKSKDLLAGAMEIDGIKVVALEIDVDSAKELRESADRIRDNLKSGVILLGAVKEDRAMLICMVTKDLVGRFNAGDIIRQLSAIVGGKGGGRPDMAQGGGNRPEDLKKALKEFEVLIEKGAC